MGNRCHVFNACNFDAGVLNRANRGFSTRSRSFDFDINSTYSMFHGFSGSLFCRLLRSKWSDFLEPLNPTLPAEAHDTTFPCWSLKLMMVLLKEL